MGHSFPPARFIGAKVTRSFGTESARMVARAIRQNEARGGLKALGE